MHRDPVPPRGRRRRGRLAESQIRDLAEKGGFRKDELVLVSSGEGQTSEGEFWEAISSACNLKLPVLFLIEDNGYAISVPVEVNTPGGSISKLLRGFPGLFLADVDGCDFLESYDALRYAAEYCRSRMGPAVVHAHVVRPSAIRSPTTRRSTGPRRSGSASWRATPSRRWRAFSCRKGFFRRRRSRR